MQILSKKIILPSFAVLFMVMLSPTAFAHSGGTDANGGHTCWTNCDANGYRAGEYHFYSGAYAGLRIPDGALIRAEGGIDVYVVKNIGEKKFKRLILSPSVFDSYGHLRWEDIMNLDQGVLDTFTTSNLVRATVAGDPRVYELFPLGDTGEKRWIKIAEEFTSLGYDWDAIYTINTTDRNSYIETVQIDLSSALCGSKAEQGSLISDVWVEQVDCLSDVQDSDGVYAYVKTDVGDVGRGVGEFVFQIPAEVEVEKILSARVNVEMLCRSGLGIQILTPLDEWTAIGQDLPTEEYKPDGSYGYLSCSFDAMQEKELEIVPGVHEGIFGIRISEDEVTAEAWIDRVFAVIKVRE